VTVWVRKLAGFDEEARADREFWAQLSADQRVAVVEDLRREWIERQSGPEAAQRLQRVVRVLRRPPR
jgi:hypothetical protein